MKQRRRIEITTFRRRTTVILRERSPVELSPLYDEADRRSEDAGDEGKLISQEGLNVQSPMSKVMRGSEVSTESGSDRVPLKKTPQSRRTMMNSTTKKLAILIAAVLTIGFLLAEQTAAQSTISRCKKIHGGGTQSFDPATGVISGPITSSGLLNGTLEDVVNFAAGVVFTPDPTVLTYLTDLTITTVHGQLKSSNVTTQSVVTAIGTEWGHLNPNLSTGRFAGATGMIFITFKPVGDPAVGPYEAQFSGEICFASEPPLP